MIGLLGGFGQVTSMIPDDLTSINPVTYITGFAPQMMLGNILFSLNTAAYQEFQRTTEHRWGSHELFGKREALQYVGPGKETISLPGVIYPSYKGGTGQIDNMREAAAKGEPLQMISAQGGLLGMWVIESIDEKQTTFAGFGIPRKQEFTLKLRCYEAGDGFDQLVQAIKGLF